MAERKIIDVIPKQSMIYIAFCLAGLLIFLLAGILPNVRTMDELANQTAVARFQLEERKTLSPLQKTLLEQSTKKESDILPLPGKEKLAGTKIDTLPIAIGAMAKTSGMSMISAIPSLNALVGDAPFLSVNVVLRGDFINFRKFLIHLGSLPHMQQIEEIAIEQKGEAKEFRLKLWVAVG